MCLNTNYKFSLQLLGDNQILQFLVRTILSIRIHLNIQKERVFQLQESTQSISGLQRQVCQMLIRFNNSNRSISSELQKDKIQPPPLVVNQRKPDQLQTFKTKSYRHTNAYKKSQFCPLGASVQTYNSVYQQAIPIVTVSIKSTFPLQRQFQEAANCLGYS